MSQQADDDPARSARTADRLLDIAAALFREKGYAATTTRELADRLRIQKASLYHHIRSKEDLLLSISLESLRRVTTAVAAASAAAPPDQRLHDMIIAHVGGGLADRDLHTTMLVDLRSLSPGPQREVTRKRSEYEQLFVDAITAEQRAGRVRTDIDAHGLTLALLNLLNWTIFWYDPDGPLSAAAIAEMLATVFLDGARVRPR